jgi:hypothetical protein
LRGQALSVGLAVYASAWTPASSDPVFGQPEVDLGFKSVVASLEGESNPISEHCQPLPRARGVAKFDCQFSKVEERNCGKKSDQANGSLYCATSLRSLIIWTTNCGLHGHRPSLPATRPGSHHHRKLRDIAEERTRRAPCRSIRLQQARHSSCQRCHSFVARRPAVFGRGFPLQHRRGVLRVDRREAADR